LPGVLLSSLVFPSLAAAGKVTGKVDHSLVGNYQDSIVYVADALPRTFTPPAEPAVIEQRDQAFVPHVTVVLQGTTVRFPNNDRVRHNVFSPSAPKPFNFGIYPPGAVKEMTFDQPGVVSLLCNIHENMSAFVLIVQNPYFARVASDGKFQIHNIPDGIYTFTLWSEKRAPVSITAMVKDGNAEVDFKAKTGR
jgi:plastocyanin